MVCYIPSDIPHRARPGGNRGQNNRDNRATSRIYTGRGSDIDVVIISDDFAGKGYWERIDILADAIYEIFAPIEAVAMTPEEWERGDSLIAAFARKGEVLYAA
mgnify:CR=1 FL=1